MGAVRLLGAPAPLDVPIQLHRMLAAEADITGARLIVRRVAGGHRAHLSVTAKVPDPAPVTTGPTVALHLGWRGTKDGVRVGTWRTDGDPWRSPCACANARTATVEPGVALDELRAALSGTSLPFGPDPATHSRCTLSGIEALEILTHDGVWMWASAATNRSGRAPAGLPCIWRSCGRRGSRPDCPTRPREGHDDDCCATHHAGRQR